MLRQRISRVQVGGRANEKSYSIAWCFIDFIHNRFNLERLVGSLMEKTLAMHIEELKKRIINQIREYEFHVNEPSDAAYNAGLERAIEAVKETEYVTE